MGATTMTVMKGPVSSMARVTDHSIAKNEMIAGSQMISEASVSRDDADCDADGVIEPLSYRETPGYAPAGGGLMPAGLGASYQDPWGSAYGYCAWDQGAYKQSDGVAACGGGSAARLDGPDDAGQAIIVLISAGPNKQFETSCHAWVDGDSNGEPDVPLIQYSAGKDDIIYKMAYSQFLMPASAQARLEDLPDAACTAQTVGIMRMVLGVMQVCTGSGWSDIAPASGGDMDFIPVTNAMLESDHISNTITLGTLGAPLPVSVSGGASLSINGGPPVTSGAVSSGDTLRISAAAAAAPETTLSYDVQIGSVTKSWLVTTRDAYIAQLSITPASHSSMDVTGPGNPAHSATTGFIVTNTGERPTAPLQPASLSNPAFFEFNADDGYAGDDCAGKTLMGTVGGVQSCVLDVRAKASNDSAGFESNLSITDGLVATSAHLSGTASGWSCPLPWGGQIAHGASVVAYLTSCALLSCTSQVRHCTNGVLSGSYTKQTCNVLLSC